MCRFICAIALICILIGTSQSFADRPATVLLITSKDLKLAWQDYAQWKTALGKATKIITVADIAKQYEGKDIQQKIKAAVLEHIKKHGTRWVVLGGDSAPGGKGHVPDRDTMHPMMRYADIPTDVYYISEKSWDANGDGIYGDWATDSAEITYTNKSVSIGRIPMRTAKDVKAYTAKVKDYEMRYPKKSFAQTFIYNCPMPMAYPKLNTSRETVSKVWKKGTIQQAFTKAGQRVEKSIVDKQLTPDFWKNMINQKKAGKWHMHGHGLLPVWVLEGHETIDKNTVSKLTNFQAYPVMTTVSCFTGQFDGKQDPSITESMLRKEKGGAITVIAPAREGVPIFADRNDLRKMVLEGKMDGTTRMLTDFWAAGLEKGLSIGESWAAARGRMSEFGKKHPKFPGYHWVQCELNLLGDPTLDIRNVDPVDPKIEVPKSIRKGKQVIKVSTGVPDSRICVWMGEQVYKTTQADSKGEASIEVQTTKAGTMLITVSGPHLNARQEKIEVR